MLLQLLALEGVNCLPVPIGGHTRESFTVRELRNGQEYRFVLPGPLVEPAEVALALQTLNQQAAPRYLVVSGSLPPGVPAHFYGELAAIARNWNARLVVDGSGPALRAALDSGVYMVKPSLRELREITGQPLTSLQAVQVAAQKWVADGQAEVVAVSLGDKGAVLVCAQEALFAPALTVSVVSAVGAGDSFVAGMVWALAEGQTVQRAFALAVAAGSAALSSSGTGLCAPDDVHRTVKSVRLVSEFPEMAL